jgi:hypothetical protein
MVDLTKLNSLTKYPSIPTYHSLERGKAFGDPVIHFPEGFVIGTEKIDGVNARIILLPDARYIIGSREEFLYHSGDVIHNPALGIVNTLRPTAQMLSIGGAIRDAVRIYYFEVYGSNVTAASKNYTSKKEVAFRLFDVSIVGRLSEHMERTPEAIASWRDAGGPHFIGEDALQIVAKERELSLTPRIFKATQDELPSSVLATKTFLEVALPKTHVYLDDEAQMRPEGIVLRTSDRSVIAKMKFRDYK